MTSVDLVKMGTTRCPAREAQEAQEIPGFGGDVVPASATEVLRDEKHCPESKEAHLKSQLSSPRAPQPELTGRDKMQVILLPRRLISKHNCCARQWAFPRRDRREERKTKRQGKRLKNRAIGEGLQGDRRATEEAGDTLPWPVWQPGRG